MVLSNSKIILGATVVGSALFGTGLFYYSSGENRVCDEVARRESQYSFAESRIGNTHYELSGPKDRPLIVLIHGVSGPMKVWDKLVPALLQSGYQVLRYDLFGRGLSDRISVEYTEEVYDRQLEDLLTQLRVEKRLVLVGSSMGAVIAAGFHNRHPSRVMGLVLIGPAGFPIQANPLSKLMRLPGVGEYVMGVLGTKTLMGHHWKYFYHPEKFPEMHEAFRKQLAFKGTKGAILSTMRNMPVQGFEEGYRKVGRSDIPVLLLWGKYDVTFPFENHSKAQTFIPQSNFVAIDDAAHLPQYEKATDVTMELLQFLARES